MPRAGSIGWVGKVALAIVLFLLIDRTIDQYTIVFLALCAVVLALLLGWVVDIIVKIISYYRHGNSSKSFGQVLTREVNRRTPKTDRIATYAAVLVATGLVISATVGTGVAPVDNETPSYDVPTSPSVLSSDTASSAPNESDVGGSFERIQLDSANNRITLFVRDTDGIDAVVVVGPSGRQLASDRISVGTRRMALSPSRSLTNGTYEIIGVGYDVNSENILLSRAEERESHEVRLNTTA